MKRVLLIFGLLFALNFGTSPTAEAQIVVSVRPTRPAVVVKRPAARRGHVWIDGHWKARGNRYVWVKGRWVRARRGFRYQPGKWVTVRGGYRWQPGVWVRVRR
ncbi:MAG: YXWGXW repeat-containing protein [Flammeovirgaceae bacterium]